MKNWSIVAGLLISAIAGSPSTFAQSPDIILGRVLGNSRVKDAVKFVENDSAAAIEIADGKRLMETAGFDLISDGDQNLIGLRPGIDRDAYVMVMARLESPSAIGAMLRLRRALDAVSIGTKATLVFVGVNTALNEGEPRTALFEGSSYYPRIKACVLIQVSSESVVVGAANSIGSTIVQYGLQSVFANGIEPSYEKETGLLDVPIQLKIPSIAMGIGVDKPMVKGIQSILAAVLAIAGVQ